MADVLANIYDWSVTTASNFPNDDTTIGASLADNFQQVQATVRTAFAHKGADIASAATTDIGAVAGLMHDITGTTTITGFGTVSAGIWKVLKFEGALTLTHNSTSLILPSGANITTANGDIGIFISEGSGNWRCVSYTPATGKALVSWLTSGTEQATTSGTEIDFTGIPSWVKKITIQFEGVSVSGTSIPLIQLGDSGGVETSGYVGDGTSLAIGSITTVTSTSGFLTEGAGASARARHGAITLTLKDSANFTWVASGAVSGSSSMGVCAGSKSLSAALDRIRITTVNGTDTFDAGSVNILYE